MRGNIEGKSSAYLLPDKIIIETMYKKNEGTWFGAGLSITLPLNVSDFELGEAILNAISQAKTEDISYEKIKEYWRDLIKKSKYKTEKAFFQNTKHLSIVIEGEKIMFVPFKTSISRRAFARISDKIIETTPVPEADVIGRNVRKGWEKCFFID